jgi:photosystem II stability/assembly factor-like uncharacterized protein
LPPFLIFTFYHISDATEHIEGAWHGDKLGYYLTKTIGQSSFNIYQTTDNGDNWTKVKSTSVQSNLIVAPSSTTAIIFGKSKEDLKAGFSYTFDKGKTWTDRIMDDGWAISDFTSCSFYDEKNGYIVGRNWVLYKMTLKTQ